MTSKSKFSTESSSGWSANACSERADHSTVVPRGPPALPAQGYEGSEPARVVPRQPPERCQGRLPVCSAASRLRLREQQNSARIAALCSPTRGAPAGAVSTDAVDAQWAPNRSYDNRRPVTIGGRSGDLLGHGKGGECF